MMFDKLAAPFPPEAIHWRAQTLTGDGSKALALAYLDARDVADRLDEVVTPACWQDYYDETNKGRVLCKLSIRVGDEWITKTDGSGDSDIEGEKGGISGAFKRAGVKWGIGRYLYDLGNVWAPCETYKGRDGKLKWKAWKPEARAIFEDALTKVSKPVGPINETTATWLINMLDQGRVPPAELLAHFSPKSINELTFAQMSEAKRFIESKRKAA